MEQVELRRDFEEMIEEKAIFVYSSSPIPENDLTLEVIKLGGAIWHGDRTPLPSDQVRHLAAVAGSLEGKTMLDGGCASGTPALYAALGNPEKYGRPKLVIGVDRHAPDIEVAKKLAARYSASLLNRGQSVPVLFVTADMRNLDFLPDNSIDIINCSYSTSLEECGPISRELLRVIKNGGLLYMTYLGLDDHREEFAGAVSALCRQGQDIRFENVELLNPYPYSPTLLEETVRIIKS